MPDRRDGEDEQDAGVHVRGDHARRQRDDRERDQVGHQRHGRRQLEDGRSAAAGVMSSFWTNFTPSATSWAHPWKPPAYIGPSRPCMCAITLCSVCPTSSGRTRKAARTPTVRRTTSRAGLIGAWRAWSSRPPRRVGHTGRGDLAPAPGAPARPGRSVRSVPAAPRRPPPAPWPPATPCSPARRGRTTCAAACPRSPRAAAAGAARGPEPSSNPSKLDAEHLVRLALVPGRAGPQVGEARHRPPLGRPGCARAAGAASRAPERAVDQVADDVEPGGLGVVGLVDGAEPVEEVEALRRAPPAGR